MKKSFAVMLSIAAMIGVTVFSGCGKRVMGGNGRISSSYDHAEEYSTGNGSTSDKIEKLDLNWISGGVTIETGSGKEISFREEANQKLDEDTALHYWIDGDTLHIQYCKDGVIQLLNSLTKELIITVPEDYKLEDCQVDAVSADIDVTGIHTEEFSLDTVSGSLEMKDCIVTKKIDADTTSGDVYLNLDENVEKICISTISGKSNIQVPYVENLDFDSTSGNLELVTEKAPDEISADTISGSVKLNLPAEVNAVVNFNTISGRFSSDLPASMNDDEYIFGSGDGNYDIDTTSGDFAIVKR